MPCIDTFLRADRSTSQVGNRLMKTIMLAGVLLAVLAGGVVAAAENAEMPPPVTAPKADATPPPTPRSQVAQH